MKAVYTLLVIAIFVSGCGMTGKPNMKQQELLRLIESKQAPVIVDVRSESEYKSGHVPGAIHISFWAAFSPAELEAKKQSEPLVLYCQHGPRAGIAKLALSLSGFDNIVYLDGHMTAWMKAKLPVEK